MSKLVDTVRKIHVHYLPLSVARLENPQTDIPRIAKENSNHHKSLGLVG